MHVVISSGHGLKIRGASGSPVPPQCDEVDEARRVVNRTAELLRGNGTTVTVFHDDVSTTQSANLDWIVDHHNGVADHDLDVSVHFNAFDGSAHGCEVLYTSSTGLAVADKLVDAICAASLLTNRGPKERNDLAFLNGTRETAVLIETAFCDNTNDCNIYRQKFEKICRAIASTISGQVQPGPEPEPPTSEEEAIMQIAMESEIADYSWRDRGKAPAGYIKGFALAWAQVVHAWQSGDAAAIEMAKADTRDDDVDALSVYADEYDELEMNNREDGIDTLRHLYALLMGLGMRESSGEHCCGRDQSADNTDPNTCEAGLYQTSYNAHDCCDEFDQVMAAYESGERAGYLEQFAEDVSCTASNWECYGNPGDRGYQFQALCKKQPAFAVESCALVLRNRCQHYGPIKRKEAELKSEAEVMLRDVQNYVMGSKPESDLEARVTDLEAAVEALDARVTALEQASAKKKPAAKAETDNNKKPAKKKK